MQSRAKPAADPLPPHFSEQEQQTNDDYEWCLHDPEVQKTYAGKVVIAHKRQVIGAGKNHAFAWRAASRKRSCPPKEQVAFVYIEGIPIGPPLPARSAPE